VVERVRGKRGGGGVQASPFSQSVPFFPGSKHCSTEGLKCACSNLVPHHRSSSPYKWITLVKTLAGRDICRDNNSLMGKVILQSRSLLL